MGSVWPRVAPAMATCSSIVGARAVRPFRWSVAAAVVVLAVSGCSLLATPRPPAVRDASLAPSGSVGYVVCPNAVTPVELGTATPEAAIALPLPRPPSLGNFAIAASPDGRAAYVVTTVDGPTTSGPSTSATASSSVVSPGAAGDSQVIPIDLVSQRPGRPIPIPGLGGTHAIVVLPGEDRARR